MKFQKLPPKFKKKWVAALRSGKYKQGQNALMTEEGTYCCLGVACRVAGSPIELDQMFPAEDSRVPKILRSEDTELNNTLAKRNDSGLWSFNRIADWIEKNL